jgi:hypothetical protein
MMANLIDEYHLQLCPVFTGDGRGLFTEAINSKICSLEVRKYNRNIKKAKETK